MRTIWNKDTKKHEQQRKGLTDRLYSNSGEENAQRKP